MKQLTTASSGSSTASLTRQLNRHLTSLAGFAGVWDAKGQFGDARNNLRELRRRLLVCEILDDRVVIAVTGLQGVGKTTLIRQWYDLRKDFLPESLARDETLPILIVESREARSVTATVVRLGDDPHALVVRESIALDQVSAFTRAPDPEACFLELRVPFRHFNDERRAILLLPGLEHRAGSTWEPLVRHALFSSSTCVFVTNTTKLTDSDSRKAIQEIRAHFAGIAPILIMTHSDTSVDDNAHALEELCDQFQVAHAERSSRAVSVGERHDLVLRWGPRLTQAIRHHAPCSAMFHTARLSALHDLLDNEIRMVLAEVETARDGIDVVLAVKEIRAKEHEERLREEFAIARAKFAKVVSDAVSAAAAVAMKDNDTTLVARDWWDKLWDDGLSSDSLEKRTGDEQRVGELWEERILAGRQASGLRLAGIVADKLRLPEPSATVFPYKLLPAATAGTNPLARKPVVEVLTEPRRAAVAWVMGAQTALPEADDISYALKALPYLCIELIRLADGSTVAPSAAPGGAKEAQAQLHGLIDQVRSAGGDGRRLAATLASLVLGADVADGSVDSIPAIGATLGITLAPAAVAVLSAVAAVWAVGTLAYSVYRSVLHGELQRSDREKDIAHVNP